MTKYRYIETAHGVDRYPDFPGHRGNTDTSIDAAIALAPKLGRLQRMVLEAVKGRGSFGLTPEEAADLLNIDRVSAQPRFSEIKRKGLIFDSGLRRINPSSRKRAVVWVAVEFASKSKEANHGE